MTRTKVVAVGIEAAELRGYKDDVVAMPADAPADAVARLADELDSDLVALVPATRREPAVRRLQVLASALDGRHRIAIRETSSSPLAAQVVARMAAAVADEAGSAALLADVVSHIEEELLVAAVLPGVLRLRTPRPRFTARLRSLLPGARFLVCAEPEPLVSPLHGKHRAPALIDEPGGAIAVLTAGRVRNVAADTVVADAFPGAEVDDVEAPSGTAAHWRATQALEAIAYPTDAAAMTRRVLARRATPCPWCDQLHAALPCALCGHDHDRQLVGVAA